MKAPMGKCPTCGVELAERLLKSPEFSCPKTVQRVVAVKPSPGLLVAMRATAVLAAVARGAKA